VLQGIVHSSVLGAVLGGLLLSYLGDLELLSGAFYMGTVSAGEACVRHVEKAWLADH